MPTRRRKQFLYWLALWLSAALVGLVALGSFTVDQYYAGGLVGVLVVSRATAPSGVSPRWRSRLTRVIVLCLAGFAAIVVWRILQVFPWSVV